MSDVLSLKSPTSDRSLARARVALVLHGAGWAGTERHVRTLLAGLPEHGFIPELVTSEAGPLQDVARSRGVGVHLVPRGNRFSYVLGLRRLFHDLKPQIVHAHSGRLPCLAARWAGGAFAVETRHGLPERLSPLYRRWPSSRVWESIKCHAAHRTVAVCAADAEWLVAGARMPPNRVRIVFNGIGPPDDPATESGSVEETVARALPVRGELRASLGLPPSALLVGFVGRLAPEKAPERALDLMARLAQHSPELHGIFCGDGSGESLLRQQGERLEISKRLHWLGARDDAVKVIEALDLLLLPSRVEGLPYVVLDALRFGVPILATPVGGIPELLNDPVLIQGCRAWEEDGWTHQALLWLAHPESRAAWRQAALQRVMSFSARRMVEETASIYRELLMLERASHL